MDDAMARLILVPQYPTKLRYQEWWWTEFPKWFKCFMEKVIVLGQSVQDGRRGIGFEFAPTTAAIQFEAQQIKEYMELQLEKDDVLLLCDLSYPGLFANVLFHKRPKKCYAICHATSKNAYDYFAKDRENKYPVEKATAKLFDKIFVGSQYHANKLGWDNIVVHALPNPPFKPVHRDKIYQIVNVSRPGIQKRTRRVEKFVQKRTGINILYPGEFHIWDLYYEFLAKSKVLLITSKEETYGYQVVDAILNGCIPIAPRAYSYPELLPDWCLYSTKEECAFKVEGALKHSMTFPKLLTNEPARLFFPDLSYILNHE